MVAAAGYAWSNRRPQKGRPQVVRTHGLVHLQSKAASLFRARVTAARFTG